MAWIYTEASPATASGPGSVVSVELLPLAPGHPASKAASAPVVKARMRHAGTGSRQRMARAHMRPDTDRTSAPELAKAGRHALPAPSRPRVAEVSHPVTAPGHAGARSPAQLAAASRHRLDLVRRHLERFKFYPESARRRGIGGNVDVGFRLTAGGHAVQVRIASSSGYALLDQAAEAIVARAVPFPVDTGQYRVRLRFWP